MSIFRMMSKSPYGEREHDDDDGDDDDVWRVKGRIVNKFIVGWNIHKICVSMWERRATSADVYNILK